MVVLYNLSAQNAYEAMRNHVTDSKKRTEKLSSGYAINRSADNAAGFSISEKMRSQVRGLSQASNNSNDAISLIQTAEAGLEETENVLQRMRELAVQSSNGTYTDDDREKMQYEIDSLKSEIDRIAESTEFNTMKLLKGEASLDFETKYPSNEYGARCGSVSHDLPIGGGKVSVSSNISGVYIEFTTQISGRGGENAYWVDPEDDRFNDTGNAQGNGQYLKINLEGGKTYTDNDINKLIDNAKVVKEAEHAAPKVRFRSERGSIIGADCVTASSDETVGTNAGVRQVVSGSLAELIVDPDTESAAVNYSDTIKFTANTYGSAEDYDTIVSGIRISVDSDRGSEQAEVDAENATVHLATGTDYTNKDIERIMSKAGLDYSVSLTDDHAPDGDRDGVIRFNVVGSVELTETVAGAGVGLDDVIDTKDKFIFQIGANGIEDQKLRVAIGDMSASALGLSDISVKKTDEANAAINSIDDAIQTVSSQRAKLGAAQNRLEHTVRSLSTYNANITAAESQIRDTDMAYERVEYTKTNILQQASESMFAQANQIHQGVLQLINV